MDVAQEFADISDADIESLYKAYDEEKTGLRIGVLASNPKLYSNKRIMEAGAARPRDGVPHDWRSSTCIRPRSMEKHPQPVRRHRPRIKPAVTFYGCALLRQFKHLGVYCQNSADAITHCGTIYASHLFSENDINIPITGFAIRRWTQGPHPDGQRGAAHHQAARVHRNRQGGRE